MCMIYCLVCLHRDEISHKTISVSIHQYGDSCITFGPTLVISSPRSIIKYVKTGPESDKVNSSFGLPTTDGFLTLVRPS